MMLVSLLTLFVKEIEMSYKRMLQLSMGAVLWFAGYAYAGCSAHASPDQRGVCQCDNGFVMDEASGKCHSIRSSEANVLP